MGSDFIVVVIDQTFAFLGIVAMDKIPNSPIVILHFVEKSVNEGYYLIL